MLINKVNDIDYKVNHINNKVNHIDNKLVMLIIS